MLIGQQVASLGMEAKKEMIEMMMKMTVEMTPLVMMTMAQDPKRHKEETLDSVVMETQQIPQSPGKIVPLMGRQWPRYHQ